MSKILPRIPLNDSQKEAIARLHGCSFLPGSFDKRFARDIHAQMEQGLTVKQYRCLKGLLFKYRGQIYGPTRVRRSLPAIQQDIETRFPELSAEINNATQLDCTSHS